jgi:hypothetical protein
MKNVIVCTDVNIKAGFVFRYTQGYICQIESPQVSYALLEEDKVRLYFGHVPNLDQCFYFVKINCTVITYFLCNIYLIHSYLMFVIARISSKPPLIFNKQQ